MKSYSYVLLSVLILISSAGCAARREICEDFRVVVVGNEFKILANCWKEVDMGLLDDITVFDAHLHNRCQDGKYDWWNLPVVPTNDTVRVQREKDRSFVLAFPCRGPTHFHSDFIDINTNDDNPCLVLPHCEWIGHKDGEIRVFFRMRKRHLLPALHDGMQGDEDGMQTCERPPLWAFGWPRGGVHMFTSLHVACLARVA